MLIYAAKLENTFAQLDDFDDTLTRNHAIKFLATRNLLQYFFKRQITFALIKMFLTELIIYCEQNANIFGQPCTSGERKYFYRNRIIV